MNKVNGMVGFGKYQNGVLSFVDATGKGFVKTMKETIETRTIEPYEVPRDILKASMAGRVHESVQLIEKANELDVPSFMKDRKPAPVVEETKTATIYQFPVKAPVKRTLREDAKRAWNWLWNLED